MQTYLRATVRTLGLAAVGVTSTAFSLFPRTEDSQDVTPPVVTSTPSEKIAAEPQNNVATTTESSSVATVEKRRFAGAFLNSDGKTTLQTKFKPLHTDVIPSPHLTISYNPKGANLARLATQLGRPVDLKVSAIVSDKHAQTAVVEVVKATEDDDGGVPFMVENATPHVTISIAGNEHDGYGPFYSNHLLARATAAAGDLKKEWKGILPAKDGYEETECEIVIPQERTVLTATLCVSDQWDNEANRCGEEKGCGFCRFMKLGPCGKEFSAWEACIDSCKETEEDFVDKCAQQILVLKSCVDINPEYYYSVLENDEDKNESSEELQPEEGDAAAGSAGEKSVLATAPELPFPEAQVSSNIVLHEQTGETTPTDDADIAKETPDRGNLTLAIPAETSSTTESLIEVDPAATIDIDARPTDAQSLPTEASSTNDSTTTEADEDNYMTKG